MMGAYDGNIKSIWIMKGEQLWVSWKRKVHDILEELKHNLITAQRRRVEEMRGPDGEDAGTEQIL